MYNRKILNPRSPVEYHKKTKIPQIEMKISSSAGEAQTGNIPASNDVRLD